MICHDRNDLVCINTIESFKCYLIIKIYESSKFGSQTDRSTNAEPCTFKCISLIARMFTDKYFLDVFPNPHLTADISSIAKLYGKEMTGEDGLQYMNIEKLGVDFTLKNARFKVRDNVNTGNILGEAINQFLNQNANELVQEMRPAASQSISKLFKKILDQAFSHIPLKTWLLDDDQ